MSHPMHTSSAKRAALAAIRRAHPGNSCAAQCARILAALERFAVTTYELMRFADTYDPRARVMQLRRSGKQIDTHWKTIVTESGDRHRVGLYVLRPVSQEVAL